MYGAYGGGSGYGASALAQRREEQIQELLRTRPEVTPCNAERSAFKFGLNIQRGGQTNLIVIKITLPANFPDGKPHAEIQTAGVRHNWVDKAGAITGCSSIYSWNAYSRLAQVIGDIMTQFVQNPPQVLPAGASAQQASSYGDSRRSSLHKPRVESEDDPDGVFIPPLPDSRHPELDELSLDELLALQNNTDGAFRKFFDEQPIPTMCREMSEQVRASNEEQARKNLQFKDKVEDLQRKVLTHQSDAMDSWNEFQALSKRHKAAMAQFDPLRLLTQLESSSRDVDDESDALAREFMDGDVELPTYIKRYLELRKLYHLRRAKAERFRAMLKQ